MLKITMDADCRRVSLPAATFGDLAAALESLFEVTIGDVKVHYVDEDGDRVLVSSTPELVEAFAHAGTQSKTLKVFLSKAKANGSASATLQQHAERKSAKEAEKVAKNMLKAELKEAKQQAKAEMKELKQQLKEQKKAAKSVDDAKDSTETESSSDPAAAPASVPTRGELLVSVGVLLQDPTCKALLRARLSAIVEAASGSVQPRPADPLGATTTPPSQQVLTIVNDANLPEHVKNHLTLFMPHLTFKLDRMVLRALSGGQRGGRWGGWTGHHHGHGFGHHGFGHHGHRHGGRHGGPQGKLTRLLEALDQDAIPSMLEMHPKLSMCFERAYHQLAMDSGTMPFVEPVACSGCNAALGSDLQYHCAVCPGTLLCASCEAKGDEVHPSNHPLIKYAAGSAPAPAPASSSWGWGGRHGRNGRHHGPPPFGGPFGFPGGPRGPFHGPPPPFHGSFGPFVFGGGRWRHRSHGHHGPHHGPPPFGGPPPPFGPPFGGPPFGGPPFGGGQGNNHWCGMPPAQD